MIVVVGRVAIVNQLVVIAAGDDDVLQAVAVGVETGYAATLSRVVKTRILRNLGERTVTLVVEQSYTCLLYTSDAADE